MADRVLSNVRVADIVTRDRLRPVYETGVEALMASIEQLGRMTDPPHLRRVKGSLEVVAGGHRVEVARRLGWETMEAWVYDRMSDAEARLHEIDDNLAGAEMNPLDTAIFLAERKAVYEEMHPMTKAESGASLVARRWNTAETISVVSFAAATAQKFGLTDRHIRNFVAVGSALRTEAHLLRMAPTQMGIVDLMALAKITDATERAEVIAAVVKGEAKGIAKARAMRAARLAPVGEASVPSEAEQAFKRLVEAWKRAPVAAKKRFLFEHSKEVWEAQNKGPNPARWQDALDTTEGGTDA